MNRTLLTLLLTPVLIWAVQIAGADEIFGDDFESFAEGARPIDGWTYATPGANINEVTVRATTNATGEAANALRVLHDYDGAGGENSKNFGGFVTEWGQSFTDTAVIFTTRFRFNDALGSQDIALSLQASGVIGPYVRFIDDARQPEELQGIAVYDGANPLPLISGIIFGDWYEMTVTTVPTTGQYSIEIVNLNSDAAGQSGSMRNLGYLSGSGALDRFALGRAGTFPQVDMSFDSFLVEDNVIFTEDFSAYADGTRPEEWTWATPGANINDQYVRDTTGPEWEATKALRIHHDYDGAGGENSKAFGGFVANWGRTIEDEPIIFTTRFRFNELLGSQDIGLSLQGSGVIGPLIRFIEDARQPDTLTPGIAANDGQTWVRILTPLNYGDWYEMTITTVPSTGRYSIEVVNLNSTEAGQSGTMSNLSYYTGPGAPGTLDRIGLARAGTWPQVDMHFDSFDVVIDPDPADPEPATLTVETRGSGSVLRDPDTELYEGGTKVELTAVPAAGYVFSHWSGDGLGSENPLTVKMSSDQEITATFIERTMAESDYLLRETFETYTPESAPTHPGDRAKADWIFSSPFPDTEVTVVENSSTGGLDANLQTMQLFRPTSVGNTIELGAYRHFATEAPVTDQELEFSIKVRYNQDLGDTFQGFFLRDGSSGQVTFGPYIAARPDSFAGDSWQVLTPGPVWDILIPVMQVGAWYQIDVTTVPSTGVYDITITNLDDPSETASRTDVPFYQDVTKLDMVQISRTGSAFVVDADYDDITVFVEGSGADLPPEAGYATWKAGYFGSADHADAGDLEDSDGDGIPNLLEYATGGDPTMASRGLLPVTEVVDDQLALTFLRLDPTDIGYVVEAASDLTGWQEIATLAAGASAWTGPAVDAGQVSETSGASMTSVTVRGTEAISSGAKRFLRLKIMAP